MSYRADKLVIDGHTDAHTHAGNGNTRRPKLASGNKTMCIFYRQHQIMSTLGSKWQVNHFNQCQKQSIHHTKGNTTLVFPLHYSTFDHYREVYLIYTEFCYRSYIQRECHSVLAKLHPITFYRGMRGSWSECHFVFSLVYQLCLALW